MPDFSGLEYLIGAIFLIAIKLGVAFSKEWITRRDDRHTRAAGLSEADLSAATWYRTSRGGVVGRLKDGRALVGMVRHGRCLRPWRTIGCGATRKNIGRRSRGRCELILIRLPFRADSPAATA